MTADVPLVPERDLALLLRGLRPQLRDGEWVFVTVGHPPDGVEPLASFAEDEGLSLVVRRNQADAAGLSYDVVLAVTAPLTFLAAVRARGRPLGRVLLQDDRVGSQDRGIGHDAARKQEPPSCALTRPTPPPRSSTPRAWMRGCWRGA